MKDTQVSSGRGSRTVEPIRSREEIERIRRVLEVSPRDLTLFVVGIHVGLRGSDLLRLDWEQLLLPSSIRPVFRPTVRLQERKTKRVATLEIPRPAKDALRTWWQRSGSPRAGLVFPSGKGGGPLLVSTLHTLVNKWAKDAGVAGHYGSHTLRKTFGFHARQSGHLTIEDLMWRFGHRSPSTTLCYLGITDDTVNSKVRDLDLTTSLDLTPRKRRAPEPTHDDEARALAGKLSRMPAAARRALAQLLQAMGEE
jgi:integrase